MENEIKSTKTRKSAKKQTEEIVTPNTVEHEQPVAMKAKEIDPNQIVIVRNGYQGRLFYKSSRTGEKFVWPEFGSEQEMELRELRNAKNSNKQFFINNWFMFDEPWIVDYLGVRQFYRNAITIDDFDDLFQKSADEIEKIVEGLSAGQKRSVSYRARQLVADGEIDSRKAIDSLERSLGIELIEH